MGLFCAARDQQKERTLCGILPEDPWHDRPQTICFQPAKDLNSDCNSGWFELSREDWHLLHCQCSTYFLYLLEGEGNLTLVDGYVHPLELEEKAFGRWYIDSSYEMSYLSLGFGLAGSEANVARKNKAEGASS